MRHRGVVAGLAAGMAAVLALPAAGQVRTASVAQEPAPPARVEPGGGPPPAIGISVWPRPEEQPPVAAPRLRMPGLDIPLGGTREPTIAVNPLDGDNVATASLFRLRTSTDGGATFAPEVVPVVDPGQSLCGDPSLAFDSQGRLFWTYLGCIFDAEGDLTGIDVYLAQCNAASGSILPGYPVNVTASPGVNLPASSGNLHDKEWLAADATPGSPFQDRLYIVWTDLTEASRILVTFSADQGQNWSAPVELSGEGEGFVWPSHNTVAPNGDAYVAYHSQPSFNDSGTPDGTSGQVFVLRSTDGGATWPQKTLAYNPGDADMTFNVQTTDGKIPGATFWLQGSAQPWVLADPFTPGRMYVVANDDPDDDPTAGDYADVYVVISTDNGQTWSAPARIDSGPGTTFQVMPTAGIDPESGCIAVHYYDNRAGATNAAGNFLLDVYATVSTDGGVTFGADFPINDLAFDPDPGAPCRFGCDPGQTPTTRIGEYNGVALGGCQVNAIWTGNRFDGGGNPTGHQVYFDAFFDGCDTTPPVIVCPPDVTVECDEPTDPDHTGYATATDNCTQGDPTVAITASSIAPGDCPDEYTITRTWTATDAAGNSASCDQIINVVDTTPPVFTHVPPDAFFEHGSFFCRDGEVLDWLDSAAAVDNCADQVTITHDAPPCGFPYDSVTVVTWTAEDACGNTAQASATVTIGPAAQGEPGVKGSVLVWPNVELRFSPAGDLLQDTFLTVTNDENRDVTVQFYFVNEFCARIDNNIVLTRNDPAYWSAARGTPLGLAPFTVLGPPVPDPEGSGDRILRGYVVAWAVDPAGHEIRWNHLLGDATIVHYPTGTAWQYTAWAFPATTCVEQGAGPLDCLDADASGACCDAAVVPGALDFDGFQYGFAPDRLLLDFFASGATAFSRPGWPVTHDADLTLYFADQDLRQDGAGPPITLVSILVWNENEVGFSGLTRCITCWNQTLLSTYGGHFLRRNLQTNMGYARIDGLASAACPGSADAALLGVVNRILDVGGRRVLAGRTLWQSGRQAATLLWDVPGPGEERPTVLLDATPERDAGAVPAVDEETPTPRSADVPAPR